MTRLLLVTVSTTFFPMGCLLPHDAGRSDSGAGTDTPGVLMCRPSIEVCNGRDDDCDGAVDEVGGRAPMVDADLMPLPDGGLMPSSDGSDGSDGGGDAGCVPGCAPGWCVGGRCVSDTVVAAGEHQTCARRPTGAAECWGQNLWGELGRTTTGPLAVLDALPGAVVGVANVASFGLGDGHSCALRTDGTVMCWGHNDQGQLGDGTTTDRDRAAVVPGLSGAVSISASWGHTCAVLATGEVSCWGDNNHGQLGDGTASNFRATPGLVSGLGRIVEVRSVSGSVFACDRDGRVWAWGDNYSGQLADGTTTERHVPVLVPGIHDAVGLGVLCVLLRSGGVRCWGDNQQGRVGDGTTIDRASPTDVSGLTDAVQLTSGGAPCVLHAGGRVSCWGPNGMGQVGDGTTTNRLVPTPVVGLTDAIEIASNGHHTCATRRGGTIVCWGDNERGELGNGTHWFTGNGFSTTPLAVHW
jgi:alpha-tubulin suppressor-like RCC1 family protein